jgi:hypothetical protein
MDVVHDAVLPMESAAWQETVLFPIGNREPDFGVQLTDTGVVPPLATGLAKVTVAPLPLVAVTGAIWGHDKASEAVGAGAAADGATTTTVDVQAAFRCIESVAVQVKEVLPTEKTEPDAGEQAMVTGGAPPLTVGVSVTGIGLPSGDVKTGEGQVAVIGGITAGVLPLTSPDPGPEAPVLSNAWMMK